MRQYIKSTTYNDNRNVRKTPTCSLSDREREFLNDILRLKNDNHNWDGRHRMDYSFNGGDNGNGWYLNMMSKELSLIGQNGKWSYQYQRKLKSRILRKYDRILADAELLKSAAEKLRRF